MLMNVLLHILISSFGWLMMKTTLIFWYRRRILVFRDETFYLILSFTLNLCVLLFALFKNGSLILQTLLLLAVEILILGVPWVVERYRRQEFEKNLLWGLDALLLSVRGGKSFHESLYDSYKKDKHSRQGFYFSEICRLIHSKQEKPPETPSLLIQGVFAELRSIGLSSHRVADRLKSYRHILALQFKIERRSKAATLQARAQSWVMVLLFSGGLVHILGNYNFDDVKMTLCLSVFFFVIGTIWVQRLGRNTKWKV